MQNVQGIIFDMDGLMFDTETLYYKATQEAADMMGFSYDFATYEKYIGVSDEEVWQAYHEMYDPLFGEQAVNTFINYSFDRAVELFEAGAADLKPGLKELLHYLQEKEVQRCVASSNQRRIIDILLEKNDLSDEFSHIVSFENVKKAKPDPEIFEKAAAAFDTSKENLLILEDSKNGVLAADQAGINVIMVPDLITPTPAIEARTLAVLPTLNEIPAFLEK
ncbi:HAD family phosphatase [Tetragenococcus koreensis]|uniref:Beta-phosphoglucomutase n=1 Tax=Tetragenococcus koreensis TaxID=290335 RepID=A0AAN4UCK4_9ENTE|nr:HAD family phosphatase [Tetragenococcus koreensis]MCF1585277.1 HAD family phosphatase [Tetragenococcus koreensis]MCF1614212.1 HAD family phosphatase [Tetragenococcus koreensis]MCF1619601.1 HAD family phosphatase [Tetragenococcus koreensis]MCF1624035.1 HAD family phosphatase [Tetragenococcus koreensis]MCF1627638.1 HAD family phosphatase [Tetragenococcus koreensis]